MFTEGAGGGDDGWGTIGIHCCHGITMQVTEAVGGSTSTSALWFDGDAYTTGKAEVFLGDGTRGVGEEVGGVGR
ncbi:hypothetical protein IPM09_01925 [Candidatus Saccharibacteria bacterium]|nr:MAG: hypothetical protein IPM09_01925 [Candidatus Saccharibacteria bacterium]